MTLAAATNATAEEVFSLDTVVVSASKSAQKQGETDGTMSVVKQESIQKNMANSVDEVFKYTPSVTVSGSGIRGDSPINIRGITGN
ncbi:MAG: TonB-dependent receptor plug domain-containing protein [Candidatus Thiothrix sulfatifontis]|nr:MAG: TonB-dependent receptor plug domain-containing protein [Candidatus Thiothrix sulfatifontis]